MKKLGLSAGALLGMVWLAGCPPLVVDGDGDDPCDTVKCAGGTHCESTEVQCIKAPCPPIVECVPDEDTPELGCEAVLCAEGTTCVETDDGPECVPQVTCAAVLCIEGTVCIETPDGPECVPQEENPCNLVDCQPDHTCVVENGEAVCVPVGGDGCDGYVCEEGQHCELLYPPCAPPDDQGLVADKVAPPVECEPVPACVENTSCDTVKCGEGTYCDDISGTAECLPLPSCELIDCQDGYICELVDVVCVRAPCPPQPECVPVGTGSSCDTVKCAEGTYCDDISGTAECLPLPSCELVDCQDGYICELVDVVCVRAPCPPQPECVPVVDDPCAGVRCKDGLICQVVDGAPVCVGKEPCSFVDCEEGSHCEMVEVVCITEPCLPVAECVPDGWCGTP